MSRLTPTSAADICVVGRDFGWLTPQFMAGDTSQGQRGLKKGSSLPRLLKVGAEFQG